MSGGAGTGKTVVLLHRARELHRRNPEARIVLTTFNRTLAEALKYQLAILDSSVVLAVISAVVPVCTSLASMRSRPGCSVRSPVTSAGRTVVRGASHRYSVRGPRRWASRPTTKHGSSRPTGTVPNWDPNCGPPRSSRPSTPCSSCRIW
ncbi:AAA family ATPase [Rhodococcus hoagii]|nr:AAA family ATPase [Prescottella equi]